MVDFSMYSAVDVEKGVEDVGAIVDSSSSAVLSSKPGPCALEDDVSFTSTDAGDDVDIDSSVDVDKGSSDVPLPFLDRVVSTSSDVVKWFSIDVSSNFK